MAEKRVNVRFGAEGSRVVRQEMEGIGQTGEAAFRGITERARELGEAVRTSLLQASRQMRTVGLAVSAVGAGVTLAIRQQLNAADELGKAASRIGVPVEALSELAFAAELSGAGLSQLETSLSQLSRRAVESPDDFDALGIAVRDAGGEMRPVAAILDDVADALAEMPEGAERVAAAQRLLGRSGADLLPLLEGGSSGLREMTDQARAFGRTISGETAANAAEFNDNMRRLKANYQGVALAVTATLLPALVDFSDRILEIVSVVQQLPPEAIEWMAKLAGIVVVGGPLLLGLAAVTKAVALLASPFVLAAGAVALLVAGLVSIWPRLVELKDRAAEVVADIADAFWAMKESVSLAVDNAVAWVREQFDALVQWFRELPAVMVQIGRDIIQGLADGIMERWDAVKGRVMGVADGLVDGFNALFRRESPSKVFMEIGRDLMEGLRIGVEGSAAGPEQAMASLAEGLTQAWDSFTNRLINNFRDIRGALAGLAQDLARAFGQSARSSLGSLLSGVFGGALQISGPAMPRAAAMGAPIRPFAGGGFTGWGPRSGGLDGQGGFLAMLHPQETVIDHARGQGQPLQINLVARTDPGVILDVAESAAVRVTRAGIEEYDRDMLPERVARAIRNPWDRGR